MVVQTRGDDNRTLLWLVVAMLIWSAAVTWMTKPALAPSPAGPAPVLVVTPTPTPTATPAVETVTGVRS